MQAEADDTWKDASLLDIANYKNGLAMQKFRPQPGDKGLPVLKIRELGQGECGPDAEWCSSDIEDSVHVRDGDLIFSWSGTLMLNFWAGGDAGLNQHLFKVTSDKYPCWFYYMWTKHHMRRFIAMAKDRATTMGHIKRSALANAAIKIPSSDVLCSQTKAMQPLIDEIVGLKIQSRKLANLRDALLPKLMSGEIDVSKVYLTQPNSHLPVYWYCILQTVPIRIWKGTTMEAIINTVLAQMQPLLNGHQLKQLAITLRAAFEHDKQPPKEDPADLLALFLTAKEVEGCSPKTIAYYRTTLEHMTEAVAKPYTKVTSDDLRSYLSDYELKRGAGKVTVDNIRRIMSSFFSWLEDEDYVVKSPVRRIHRVKCAQATKEVLTDEQVESLRDGCTCTRDLAIIEMLASTGMRVGELVRLDIADVDLQGRECVVMGKGNKQRPVYFDARTKLRINEYLALRHDDSPALFVSLRGEPKRMTIGNVETRMRELGRATCVGRVHPHIFRRTLATRAIDKGMPIEQVQKLLGHAKIDTTMRYAMVDQNNVKTSHRKYLE